MDNKDLTRKLRLALRDGLLGSMQGKGSVSDIVFQDETSVTFIVALVSITAHPDEPMDRHLVQLQKSDGTVLATKPVFLSQEDAARILRDANLGSLKSFVRLNNGAYGITYTASIEEKDAGPSYVVQLRFHGKVSSMNALQDYIREAALPDLPVPKTYRTAEEMACGLQLQVTEFVKGVMANNVYYGLDLSQRTVIVKQLARMHASLWELRIPREPGIGEAIVVQQENKDQSLPSASVTVGPERQFGIGGPFQDVSTFVKAWIEHRLAKLESQNGIDEYKAEMLLPIQTFVRERLDSVLPRSDLDAVPVVLMHTDMCLHNLIVSPEPPYALRAVIDWEFTSCLPFLAAIPDGIDPFFRKDAATPLGSWESGESTLRKAFWDEIPAWKAIKDSKTGETFLEWYNFGLYLKANAQPNFDAPPEERAKSWAKNKVVVTAFLKKWDKESYCL